MGILKSIIPAVKTTNTEDGTVYGIAGVLVLISKVTTGILPILALLIAIGQLRIQWVKYKKEKLELEKLEKNIKNRGKLQTEASDDERIT